MYGALERRRKMKEAKGHSSRAAIRLPVHCEELDDGDSRNPMGNVGGELVMSNLWLPVRM
jgi:hypothetical protein